MTKTPSPNNSRIQQLRVRLVEISEELELCFQHRTYQNVVTLEFIYTLRNTSLDLWDELKKVSHRDCHYITKILINLVASCDALADFYSSRNLVNYYTVLHESLRPQIESFNMAQHELDGL